jgi:hypothetical protein
MHAGCTFAEGRRAPPGHRTCCRPSSTSLSTMPMPATSSSTPPPRFGGTPALSSASHRKPPPGAPSCSSHDACGRERHGSGKAQAHPALPTVGPARPHDRRVLPHPHAGTTNSAAPAQTPGPLRPPPPPRQVCPPFSPLCGLAVERRVTARHGTRGYHRRGQSAPRASALHGQQQRHRPNTHVHIRNTTTQHNATSPHTALHTAATQCAGVARSCGEAPPPPLFHATVHTWQNTIPTATAREGLRVQRFQVGNCLDKLARTTASLRERRHSEQPVVCHVERGRGGWPNPRGSHKLTRPRAAGPRDLPSSVTSSASRGLGVRADQVRPAPAGA